MTAPLSAPVDLLSPTPANPLSAISGKSRDQIKKTAQDFEASFVSLMLGQMFQGVGEDDSFSGGEGEQMFQSFMMDGIAKKMTGSGGLGLASQVQKEMLKLQGLEG